MADFPDYFRRNVDLRIESNAPVYSSESKSLIVKKRKMPAQRWEFGMSGYVLSDNYNRFDAFLFGLNGSFETFTIRIPTHNTAPANVISSTLIDAAVKGTNTVYAVRDVNLPETEAGFFVRFTGSTKVYMVTAIEKVTQGGQLADKLTVFPQLTTDYSAGAVVDYQPEFTVRLKDNLISGTMSANFRFKVYNLAMEEAL